MLAQWMPQLGLSEFLAHYFQKAPLATPDAVPDAHALLSWTDIGNVMDGTPKPDMLIVRNGHLLDERLESSEHANAAFAAGYSIVLRRLERHLPQLAALAQTIESDMSGEVSIQSYATPGRHHSFGWHYDCEDVFIVQIEGSKEYFLRENTINPVPRLDAMPRDMQFEKETTAMVTCTLAPGDWLYIPSGWWHMAKAYEDALSVSIGLLTPRAGGRTR